VTETSRDTAVVPHEAAEPPPSLAPPPRPVTPHAARRSWNELPVRIWVILAIAVAFITIYFTVDTYRAGRYERWLITRGQPVKAEVLVIEGTRDRRGSFNRSDILRVQLGYTVNGKRYEYLDAQGQLSRGDARPAPVIFVGDTIDVRVDPANPRTWTDRTRPPPWYAELTIVLLLLPLLVALAAFALLRRRQVLNVWRKGEAAAAVVLDHKQTATAPFSRVIRFTFADGRDRRVWSTLHPAKGAPQPGETLWVIFPPGKPGRAVVASLYR